MFDENGNYIPDEENTAAEETGAANTENTEVTETPETPAYEPEYTAPAQEDDSPVYSDVSSGYSAPETESFAEETAEETTEPVTGPEYVEAQQRTQPVTPPQGGYGYGYGAQPTGNPYTSYQQPAYGGYPGQTPPPVQPEKPKKNGFKVFLAIIALVLVFALGIGVASIFNNRNGSLIPEKESRTQTDSAELTIADTPKAKTKSSDGALTPAQIAEKVRASNVGIVVYSNRSSNSAAGEGSGIIMGEDSTGTYTYIITCAHVINGSGIKVTIQTEDGQSYDADIVGFDTRTDIGVVKIKKTGFQAAEFGDSDKLVIGDPVYAVGNPGGVEFFGSFTGGFISAINRPVSSEIGYTMKCIQHDAAINPGNSGGMLINQYGQVIGINSQKIASTQYEGMGFAIPISSAKEIIDDLIQYSYIPDRPKLGITYYPVSASTQYYMIAQLKGLPAGTLIINEISADSSLNGTKAQKYDMITKVNGKELTTADVLISLIDNGKVGDKFTLTLCRVGSNYSIEEFEVEATLVEDRGDSEQTTTQQVIDPFEYFYGGGNGNGNGNNPFDFGY